MKIWFSGWLSVGHKCLFKEKKLSPGVRLGGSVGRAPARRAGDPGLNICAGENMYSFN